ncbi:MAG: NAD(+) synthase [Candidatus Competibacterales bacterium]
MSSTPLSFHSPYRHGFTRVAVCVPPVSLADPARNAKATSRLAKAADDQGAAIVLFPELGLSGYSNDDLFHQQTLLTASRRALATVVAESADLNAIAVVGLPLALAGRLFNCAAVIHRGVLLGLVPKSYLPNYREFYEKRQFAPAREVTFGEVVVPEVGPDPVPFGNDLLFAAPDERFVLFVEICEDVWTPIPPSSIAALGGATIVANPSASNITIGKADYRKTLCAAHAGRCLSAYLYSAAGFGESTTDLAWDGYAFVYEGDTLLAESTRFAADEQVIVADVDVERLRQERLRLTSFGDGVLDHRDAVAALRQVMVPFTPPFRPLALARAVDRFPFVPSQAQRRDELCYEAYNIQVHGLSRRLTAARIDKVVIGVSGGLDSTQALLVAAKTMDRLGLPRRNILAYTLPGYATLDLTRHHAWRLMEALGTTAAEIDIRPSCLQMFKDIGHPFARGEPVYDVTFENVQAGERTSHLFRLANHQGALVLGTGDLSELALGWATYGVGDHMSHYNVNASVPKTLIQYLIRWVIASNQFDADTSRVLQGVLDTAISPELVPGDGDDDQPSQRTEDIIGPYELQDFNLFYTTRYGFRPSKIAYLALAAWGDREKGSWPADFPEERRNQYDLATLKGWLERFVYRFFQISQFKRSCVPNGPKVGSGGSLSPRGDWRAPSDASAAAWLAELRDEIPDA